MKANLDKAIGYLLEDEGGYAERATEPGGAVNMGVSFATFVSWRASEKKPKPTFADLKAMTVAEATAIYTALYATPIGFNALAGGLDYAALDAAVNEGLHGALGLLSITSPLKDMKTRIGAISDVRLLVKKLRPEWAKDGPGWTARIGGRVVSRASAMV